MGAFCTSPTLGVEAITGLIPIHLHLQKLSGRYQIRTTNLSSNHAISSTVRHGSHQGGSLQNGLRDEQTCGMTLASAYVLHRLSAAWSQLQMKEGKSEWE